MKRIHVFTAVLFSITMNAYAEINCNDNDHFLTTPDGMLKALMFKVNFDTPEDDAIERISITDYRLQITDYGCIAISRKLKYQLI